MSKRPGFFKRWFTSSNRTGLKLSKTGATPDLCETNSPRPSKDSLACDQDCSLGSVRIGEDATPDRSFSTVVSPKIQMDIEPSSPLFPSNLSKFPSSGTMREDALAKSVGPTDDIANEPLATNHQVANSVDHSIVTSSSQQSQVTAVTSLHKISNFSVPRQKEMPDEDSTARKLYDHRATFVGPDEYVCWLGSDGEEQKLVRPQFMSLFNFTCKSILRSLRMLCDKLYMKAESQQLNRVIEAFSQAWCEQNPNHGFYDSNVVYTISYALVLLNTDIYAADHTVNKRISRASFVRNTMETIRAHASNVPALDGFGIIDSSASNSSLSSFAKQSSVALATVTSGSANSNDTINLVNEPSVVPLTKEWEAQIELILKVFYTSVSKEALKLHLVENSAPMISSNIYSNHLHAVASTPSLRSAANAGNASPPSIFGRMSLSRLRRRPYENQSRLGNYIDQTVDGFRRDSLGSVFSAETSFSAFGLNRHAVGFAGLLWNSMIKEEESVGTSDGNDDFGDFSKIEQELAREVELELLGAPWAKEGLLMYRPYIDPTTGKKPRKKDWTQIFMVVQRGQLKMFKFDTSKSKASSGTNGVVGGGNWMESANMIDGFHLCHSMAQELPPQKKHNGFSALWSLTLPQRGLLVFQAGTSEIVREFVYTCNYWAGRLSKEPFDEPVSSMEFGWGEALQSTETRAIDRRVPGTLPGDKLVIKEWRPAGQSMVVSDVNEEKQLENIRDYVEHAESDLARHNELRGKLLQAFTPNTLNWKRAHSNWEKKSQFLLQQVIRYKTYSDSLQRAIKDRLEKSPADSASSGLDTVEDPATIASSASSSTEVFSKDSEQAIFAQGITV